MANLILIIDYLITTKVSSLRDLFYNRIIDHEPHKGDIFVTIKMTNN